MSVFFYNNLKRSSIFLSFICGNIPSTPSYGVFISQLMRYARACCYKIEVIITEVLWSSLWTRHSLRCIHHRLENWCIQRVIVFLSSFVYPGLDILWATRRVFLEKQETLTLLVHLFHAPSFKWSPSELLICFCYFVCMILFTSCSWLCMSVFRNRSLSLDYILLITAITFVPLITLPQKHELAFLAYLK